MDVQSDGQESVSVTFEWTLRGLKNLFDSTKGDTKSKVTKSPKFGDGRWQVRSSLSCWPCPQTILGLQILFYANAGVSKDGTPEGGYISLYLSCEVSRWKDK